MFTHRTVLDITALKCNTPKTGFLKSEGSAKHGVAWFDDGEIRKVRFRVRLGLRVGRGEDLGWLRDGLLFCKSSFVSENLIHVFVKRSQFNHSSWCK